MIGTAAFASVLERVALGLLVAVMTGGITPPWPPFCAKARAADGPFTLDQALERARANPRLQQAQASTQAAAAGVDEARAGWLPSASLSLGAWRGTARSAPQPGRSLPPVTPDDGQHDFYGAAAGLSQSLWDFGRTRHQVQAAAAGVRAAKTDVAVVAADVELAVRIAYHGALAATDLLRIADDTVSNRDKHLRAATTLVKVGKRPPFDATRARIDLANAQLARLASASALTQARLSLAAAIGVDDLGDVALAQPPPAGMDPDRVQVMARVSSRPELAGLEARIAAQQAQIDVRKSSHWPILSATGLMTAGGLAAPGAAPVRNWQLGVQLTAPLLAGGGDRARVRGQAAALGGLEAARAALVVQIRVEAKQLVAAVDSARAEEEATRAITIQAKENLAIAEGRYTAGVAPIIELADAQQTLTAALAQATGAVYQLAVARARLRRATGDGPAP